MNGNDRAVSRDRQRCSGCGALTGRLAVGLMLLVSLLTPIVVAPEAEAQAVPTPEEIWQSPHLRKFVAAGSGPVYQSEIQVPVEAATGMVTGTSGALATNAGVGTLKQGGSAADAAIVTALVQTVLAGGSAMSFAGVWTMLYFDAATGQTHSLYAGYNTVQEELDPMSIPHVSDEHAAQKSYMERLREMAPSGRTALVPGFMAGVQATHERFGKLPWAALFESSIYLARLGVPVDSYLHYVIEYNIDVLSRLPDTKRVFTKDNGQFYRRGDIFPQPALAVTLEKVASEGAEYMYRGAWAEKFVAAVRFQGGKMTMKDLRDYQVIWSEPDRGTYKEFEIHALAEPARGGTHIIEAFNLLELAGLGRFANRHYDSGPATFWFGQISQLDTLSFFNTDYLNFLYPGIDMSFASRRSKETSAWVWSEMQRTKGDFLRTGHRANLPDESPKHSAGVVAVDQWGNMAAVLHTINTVHFGRTGIFVDGVSIPDSAHLQRPQILEAGPGNPVPGSRNPLIVMKHGKPYLGSAAIGANLHEQSLQGIYNVLEYGMTPNEAVSSPTFISSDYKSREFSAVQGEFSRGVISELEALGEVYEPATRRSRFWISILMDPQTGMRVSSDGGTKPERQAIQPVGLAEGY